MVEIEYDEDGIGIEYIDESGGKMKIRGLKMEIVPTGDLVLSTSDSGFKCALRTADAEQIVKHLSKLLVSRRRHDVKRAHGIIVPSKDTVDYPMCTIRAAADPIETVRQLVIQAILHHAGIEGLNQGIVWSKANALRTSEEVVELLVEYGVPYTTFNN